MNAFHQHHKDSIVFHYRCFDRILLNALIQPFQQPERVVGFFRTYRETYPVGRELLRDISTQYHNWVKNKAEQWAAPILKPPPGRRDDFIEPYFRRALPEQIVAIIRAREPARILIAKGKKENNRYHLELAFRWVDQYNFYINDRRWGRMFVRVCPYFPFSARLCLNQHHWLANRMREHGICFKQCRNAFIRCSDPDALQQLADSLQARDFLTCGQKWLAYLTPFFTEKERKRCGCQHRLFFSQVEFCNNLVYRRRAGLEALSERLLDANRTVGQPDKLTVIFGHRITRRYRGKLQTVIEDLNLPNPVIRSHYKKGFIKQYVRDERILRTESATNDVTDYGVKKAVENLPKLREKLHAITENYLDVQQDILETFVDRGQLKKLAEPNISPNGKRIPGLKLDHPRQLALMQALVRFSYIAAQATFTTRDIHAGVAKAIGLSTEEYKMGSLRYELSKLRAKGLVKKIPNSRRYRLLRRGYQLCVVYLKLFEKLYAPLSAAVLQPFHNDSALSSPKITRIDCAYHKLGTALDELADAIGLKTA